MPRLFRGKPRFNRVKALFLHQSPRKKASGDGRGLVAIQISAWLRSASGFEFLGWRSTFAGDEVDEFRQAVVDVPQGLVLGERFFHLPEQGGIASLPKKQGAGPY